ncbi:4Fe-4S dicluster domain-containing protein [Planctomycetota bacterium]
MAVKKLTQETLNSLIDALIGSSQVVGVQAKGEKFDYAPLASAKDLRLDYDVTLQSPKKYMLPASETLMTFAVGGGYQSQISDESLVLVGVHPYDMVAINQMDTLFSQDNYDSHYMQRRKNITIVACDVVTPSKNGFASSMKSSVVKSGYDVLLTDVGDGFVAEAATEKGEALLVKATTAVDASTADLEKRQDVWNKNTKGLNQHELKCDAHYLPKLLEKAYDHPVWEEKAKTCFSCGSCNLVCPTCYCFDVQDDVNWDMKSGCRNRSWDGCLLDGFTKVAGDHEFRNARADRFRHRLYRKAKYVPAKIGGEIACVGCGRCVNACLPDIANPVAIYNQLLDDIGIS